MKYRLAMRRFIRWGIPIIGVLLIVVYAFISYVVASGLTKYERKPQEDNPTAYGLQFRDIEFLSRGSNVTLSGWYIPGEREGPTVILVHGIGAVRSADKLVDLASRLVDRGFNILMFDLRCHGTSGGEFISAGYFEQQDLLGAFDFLLRQGIPPERIGVVGFSMGAATTVLAAAEEPAICALVADSSYAKASDLIAQETARKTDIPEWITPMFIPGVKVMARVLYDIDIGALEPEEAAKLLSYPILIIHGTGDTRIPFEHSVRIHKTAYPGSTLWLVPAVGHVDAFLTYPEEYVERLVDYFDKNLGVQ